jgi:hypothetical protein
MSESGTNQASWITPSRRALCPKKGGIPSLSRLLALAGYSPTGGFWVFAATPGFKGLWQFPGGERLGKGSNLQLTRYLHPIQIAVTASAFFGCDGKN